MEIKVKKTTATKSETSTTLDVTAGLKIPERVKARVKSDVGEFLVERILSDTAKAKSPVEGETFPGLSPEYKKKKKAEGLGTAANLEYTGDLKDALTFEETKDGIKLGWFGDEAGKADGHNNLSGKSPLPQRRVLPDVGQNFRPDIQKGVEKIVADAITESMEFSKADFDSVTTKSELHSVLSEFFPDLGRTALRSAVTRTPKLVRLLDDLGLLDLL
jgi:hypothetical protein